MTITLEILDLIKKYHQTHNGLQKKKIADLLLERLSEFEKDAEESHGSLATWFPDLIHVYWKYHRAETGLDKLKWKAHLEHILEFIGQEESDL